MGKSVYAAIVMTLYEFTGNNVHNDEPSIITILPKQTMRGAKFEIMTKKPQWTTTKESKYTINGKEYKVEVGEINAENVAEVSINGEQYAVQMEQPAEPERKRAELGKPAATEANEEATPAVATNSPATVKAPVPGTITPVGVVVGQEVKAGDTVAILEAMKMQNNIEAGKDGKITAIAIKVGQAVLEDDPLVVTE